MEKQSQNPMAVEPIPRLMARIGTPIVLSMILQAAYNVVDSAYLARILNNQYAHVSAPHFLPLLYRTKLKRH